MIIGLTGESGAGKSTVAKYFDMSGFHIVDCDAISRTLDTDKEYISQIERAFGTGVLSFSGACKRVNRKALGALVFGANAPENAVKTLNSISHPIIIAKVHEQVREAQKHGASAVIDAPLLFESGLDGICDATVGVTAPLSMRISRLCARDGITPEIALKRFANQKNEAFLRTHCTYIIVNDGDSETLAERTRRVIENITKGNAQ